MLTLSLFVLFALGLIVLVSAQSGSTIWSDKMNYQSFDQLQAAGWTSEHSAGVSFDSNGVILDQTQGDTAIHYIGHFSSGIYNWQVEDQSRWISGSHSGNDVSAITEKHNYAFSADGWYSQFTFYHDGSKVWTSAKNTYSESKGSLFTLSMVRIESQINCYYNGQLEYTYIESDSTSSQIKGIDAVSPWLGSSEYDYFQLSSASVFPSTASSASDSVFSNPIVIGGIVGGVGVAVAAGIGLAIHFGVIGGGAAGSASAASSNAVETGLSGGESGLSGSGVGSGGGGASGPDLLADAGTPNFGQMQQANADAQQANTISNQMQQDNLNQAADRWKIQQDTQTKIMDTQQDVTQNKQKGAAKPEQDQYIRQASTDSDSSVAEDSGSSGSG